MKITHQMENPGNSGITRILTDPRKLCSVEQGCTHHKNKSQFLL